jgi:hypothetical protein
MAARNSKQTYQPTIDAGIGLIYRLNALWNQADQAALGGDMEKWNFILDTIYRNLLYRNKMEVEFIKDEKGRPIGIKNVGLMKEDILIYEHYRKSLRAMKCRMIDSTKKNNRYQYNWCKERTYDLLSMKDVWLRKFMQENGLYLKEVEFNPANAMWGG